MMGWKVTGLLRRQRAWYIVGYFYDTANLHYLDQKANCDRGLRHVGLLEEVPSKRCECGYYAYFTKEASKEAAHSLGGLLCEVQAWGGIVEHSDVLRAEFMEIKNILWLRCPFCNSLLTLAIPDFFSAEARFVCKKGCPLDLSYFRDIRYSQNLEILSLGETNGVLRELAQQRKACLQIEE